MCCLNFEEVVVCSCVPKVVFVILLQKNYIPGLRWGGGPGSFHSYCWLYIKWIFFLLKKKMYEKRFDNQIQFISTALFFLSLHNKVVYHHTFETFHRMKPQL
jgi:hypothetical protein